MLKNRVLFKKNASFTGKYFEKFSNLYQCNFKGDKGKEVLSEQFQILFSFINFFPRRLPSVITFQKFIFSYHFLLQKSKFL